jgi:hypothetical protein
VIFDGKTFLEIWESLRGDNFKETALVKVGEMGGKGVSYKIFNESIFITGLSLKLK